MYGEVVNAPAHAVVKHPENLSFAEAAASWMMYVTAFGALVEYADIKPGDNVLINAASSSVGLAAIQIAMRGAKPIAMTRTSEKRDQLLQLGAAEVITKPGAGSGGRRLTGLLTVKEPAWCSIRSVAQRWQNCPDASRWTLFPVWFDAIHVTFLSRSLRYSVVI